MSKERALLKEIIRHFAEGGLAIIASNSDVGKTLHNAQELLAQPEQEFRGLRTNGDSYSQEPVAWKDNNYGNLHHQNWGDSIPLYASPPTHKPLSDDDTVAMFKDNKLATHPDSYWAGIDDAEKAHGIAEGGE